MDFFERHKALIITSLLFSIVILALVNITLANSNKEMATTLIDLESFEPVEAQEQEPEPQEKEPTPIPKPSSVETHQAFNQDQQTTEALDARLNEIFEQNAAQSQASEEENSSTQSGELNLAKNTNRKKAVDSDGNNTSESTSTKTGNLVNSSISFSLIGRKAQRIPNPIYTCDRSGKIVVNITVNAEGQVTSTDINKASSSTSNECLTNKALQYAAGAVFSESSRNSQIGTITYNFQG